MSYQDADAAGSGDPILRTIVLDFSKISKLCLGGSSFTSWTWRCDDFQLLSKIQECGEPREGLSNSLAKLSIQQRDL